MNNYMHFTGKTAPFKIQKRKKVKKKGIHKNKYEYLAKSEHKKGCEHMSEKEKRIVEKLKDAIPQMSDFDKGYILGKVEKLSEFSQTSEDSGKKKK